MKKEELENQKLQSEIDKNKAEEEKAKKEAVEVGKRTKFRWANYIIAGVIGAAAIYSWVHSTFSDLAKERNELANVRHERLQIRSDSLLAASNELASQKDELNKQVIAITARLDSTVKQQENELGLVTARLKEEKSKDQSNREEIMRLTAQVANLNEDIKNTKVLESADKQSTPTKTMSDHFTVANSLQTILTSDRINRNYVFFLGGGGRCPRRKKKRFNCFTHGMNTSEF